jgi:hypothetical protein
MSLFETAEHIDPTEEKKKLNLSQKSRATCIVRYSNDSMRKRNYKSNNLDQHRINSRSRRMRQTVTMVLKSLDFQILLQDQ